MTNPKTNNAWQFTQISWTSGKETWITSVMVFIMVVVAAVFFFVVDWLLSAGVAMLLKLANAG